MADITELAYGVVKGRFLSGILDTADAGSAPDVIPLQGSVVFTATASVIRVVTATPAPASVFPSKLTVSLDNEGYLAHNGSRDIALWATDDTDGNPVNWQWNVSFSLHTLDNQPVPAQGFNFALPSGSAVDLSVVAPLTEPSSGTIIIKGPAGDEGAPIELGATVDGLLQWRVVGDATWIPLYDLADLPGGGGGTGVPDGGVQGQIIIKDSIANGDASWQNIPTASRTVAGISESATESEAGTGTDDTRHITPLTLAAVLAAFVDAGELTAALVPYALKASPALSGNPTAPTPATSDSDTSIATTAWGRAAIAAYAPGSAVYVVYYDSATGTWKGPGGVVVPATPPTGTLIRLVDTRGDAAALLTKPDLWTGVSDWTPVTAPEA